MAPNIIGEQTMEALRKAVTPTEADIVVAKAAIRARLDESASATRSLIDEVLASLGITPPGHNEHYDIRPELEPDSAVNPDAMQLKRSRMTHATKLAIAELVAEGVIVPAETPNSDYIEVQVHRIRHSGSERVPVSTPGLESAYRAKPRAGALGDPPALNAADGMRDRPNSRNTTLSETTVII